ncbi:MAG: histidinol-phosphatase [Fibrobacteria bacterium]|nr:histidinol-phosphatase [Fibrobacteria bacterium]
MKQYQEELTLAKYMATEASKLIMPYFQSDIQVEYKIDETPVTVADKKAEELIRGIIEKETPDYGIIGEEFGEQAGSKSFQWVIDPIDGTKAFIHGVPLFGTLIALLKDKKPVLGLIQLPALNHCMCALKGGGCSVDSVDCRVSSERRISGALLLDGSATTMETRGYGEAWKLLRKQARLHRGWGDCYGYFLVASGRAEAMVDPIVSIWDIAPMSIILFEAGGRFSDFNGEDSLLTGNAIASNGLLHEVIVNGLQPK